MKRLLLFLFVLLGTGLILAAGCRPIAPPTPQAMHSNKVLLVPREVSDDMEYMLTKEVRVMIPLLEKAGYKVVVATASGKPLVGITTTVTADLKLADVNMNDYAGFILPCMAAGDTGIIPPEAITFAQKAMATGKPIAAQQSAVQILYTAGVLKGKHYASQYDFPDAINMGNVVVQDGNLITSGVCPNMARNANLPDGTIALTQKFITALGSAQ